MHQVLIVQIDRLIMTTITHEFIHNVAQEVHPDTTYTDTAVAYIQTLLHPYEITLDGATNLMGIQEWIPLAIPGNLAKHSLSEMTKFVTREMLKDVPFNGIDLYRDTNLDGIAAAVYGENIVWETLPDLLTAAKRGILEYIIAEICELAGNIARDVNDGHVLPWDIQSALKADEELRQMFRILHGDTMLPVVATVGNNQHTHMFSTDFTSGLLLFCYASNNDFHLTMFDAPLELNYINEENRYHDEGASTYSVRIGNKTFNFNTPDFMQGFATGALWAGVDHHVYWDDLKQYTGDDENGTSITF